MRSAVNYGFMGARNGRLISATVLDDDVFTTSIVVSSVPLTLALRSALGLPALSAAVVLPSVFIRCNFLRLPLAFSAFSVAPSNSRSTKTSSLPSITFLLFTLSRNGQGLDILLF